MLSIENLPAPMAERSNAYSRVHSMWLLVDHCVLRNWDRILVRAVKGLISRAGMVSICPLLWQRDVKPQQTTNINRKSSQNASSNVYVRYFHKSLKKNPLGQFILDNTAGYNKTHPISRFFVNLGLPQNPKVVIFRKISTDSIQSKAF